MSRVHTTRVAQGSGPPCTRWMRGVDRGVRTGPKLSGGLARTQIRFAPSAARGASRRSSASPLCNGAPFFDNYAKLDAAVWVLYYSDPVYFHSFASLDAVEVIGTQHHWHTLESRSAVFDLGKQISPSFIRRVP